MEGEEGYAGKRLFSTLKNEPQIFTDFMDHFCFSDP